MHEIVQYALKLYQLVCNWFTLMLDPAGSFISATVGYNCDTEPGAEICWIVTTVLAAVCITALRLGARASDESIVMAAILTAIMVAISPVWVSIAVGIVCLAVACAPLVLLGVIPTWLVFKIIRAVAAAREFRQASEAKKKRNKS